jgi:hypothetical protein
MLAEIHAICLDETVKTPHSTRFLAAPLIARGPGVWHTTHRIAYQGEVKNPPAESVCLVLSLPLLFLEGVGDEAPTKAPAKRKGPLSWCERRVDTVPPTIFN